MKINTIKKIAYTAALSAALPLATLAQTTADSQGNPTGAVVATEATPASIVPSYGLLGDAYSEVDFGYLKNSGSPETLHDYGFVSNANMERQDDWGIDGDFKYDYMTGGALGFHDYRNVAQFGVTGFLTQSWGRPFLSADAGWAWQRAAGSARNSFEYMPSAGVELQVLRRLVVTPDIQYQAEPRLRNDLSSVADFPNHLWEYGVKTTYRFTSELSASVGLDLDQYSEKDLGYGAGLTYHY
jgi:hypothetical protein